MKNSKLNAEIGIGDLDRRISIESPTVQRDETGGETITWATAATMWAKVDFPGLGSGEKYLAEAQTSFQRVHFIVRHRSDVEPKNRVVFEGKNYDVLFCDELQRKQFLRIVTENQD